MDDRVTGPVTVFGGTGFLGRRVVRRMIEAGSPVRVATRHPDRGRDLFSGDTDSVQSIGADIHDDRSVADALAGAQAAANAVSLYVEHGRQTFHAVHVVAAERVAKQARKAGLRHLVHVSGIGADARSGSAYIRARGSGELAVRSAFPETTLIRPAVMFGPDDAFLNTFIGLLRRLPVYPMFGKGETKLQPVFVDDVAAAVATAMQRPETRSRTFECAGPRIYTYEKLLRSIAAAMDIRARLVPLPFSAWHMLARLGEWLPHPPVTRNQVELMELDNVASPDMPGLAELDITPHPVEEVLAGMLAER